MVIIHIYGNRAIFYYFLMTKTPYLPSVKWKCASIKYYSHIKIHQRLYGKMISILYKMAEKYCGDSSYLWSYSHISTILWWPRHLVYQVWNINDNLSTNIHQFFIKRYIGKWYSHSTKWENNTVVIFHIYTARAIFVLIYDDQNTEKE